MGREGGVEGPFSILGPGAVILRYQKEKQTRATTAATTKALWCLSFVFFSFSFFQGDTY